MINLSYSKIKRFLICPYIYQWVDLDKKEFRHNERYIEKRIILLAMKKYLTYLVMYNKKKDLDYLNKIFDKLWSFGIDKLLPEDIYKNIKKILLDYCDQNININNIYRIGMIDSIYLSETENRINVYFGRVDKRKNEIIIYDYTAGEDKNMLRDPHNDLWLQIYILGLNYIFAAFDKYKILRINLETGNEFCLPLESVEKIKPSVVNHIDKLLLTMKFDPTKNQFCDYCYIKKIEECELYKKEK